MKRISNKIEDPVIKAERSFEKLEDKLFYGRALKKFVKQIEDSGTDNVLEDTLERYLEELNIDLIYESERDNPETEEMRRRLNTEAGVVICNHPGYFDVPAIMRPIKRKDIKILVSNFGMFSEAFGSENFIKASKNPIELLKQLKDIKKHIEAGGLLLIFPTAGSDSVNNGEGHRSIKFKSGLRYLIDKALSPEDMVYSFNVNSDDIANIINEPGAIDRVDSVASGAFVGVNRNKFKDRKSIRVRESYSTAAEWKRVVAESDREEVNEKLSEHYLEKFETK
jgi:hypothetical protein